MTNKALISQKYLIRESQNGQDGLAQYFVTLVMLAFSQNSDILVVISAQPHHNVDILYVTKH